MNRAWVCAVILILGQLPASANARAGLGWSDRTGSLLPLKTSLRDETGAETRLQEVMSKRPVVLTFAYYGCPNLCTLVLNAELEAVVASGLRPGKDVDLVTISIDPKEGPRLAQMKRRTYLSMLAAKLQSARGPAETALDWHFLTGNQPAIQALTEAAGFGYRYDPASKTFVHPSGLLILSADGRIRERMSGIYFDPHLLQNAVDKAARGRNGSILKQVSLFCSSGSLDQSARGRKVLLFVRTLAGLTILGMLIGFWKASRPVGPEAAS